jgi:DNA replication protein DnaC
MAKMICETHGEYDSQHMEINLASKIFHFDSTCPMCEVEEEKKKVEKPKAAVTVSWHKIGIPPLYKDCSFKTFNAYCERLLKLEGFFKRVCMNWKSQIAEKGMNVLITGDPGAGKTHMAISVLKTLVASGMNGFYTQEQDFYSKLREAEWEDKSKVKASVIRPDVLVMDEIGMAPKMTDFESKEFLNLVNARTSNLRPTIFISNRSQEELSNLYGEAIWSRMTQHKTPVIQFLRSQGLKNYRIDFSIDLD